MYTYESNLTPRNQDGISHLKTTSQCFDWVNSASEKEIHDMMTQTILCKNHADLEQCNASGHCTWKAEGYCGHNPAAARAVKSIYPRVASNLACASQISEDTCNTTGLFCAWDAAAARCAVDFRTMDRILECTDTNKDCPELQRLQRALRPLDPIVNSLLNDSIACAEHKDAAACAAAGGACTFRDGACALTETAIAQIAGFPLARLLPARHVNPGTLSVLHSVISPG